MEQLQENAGADFPREIIRAEGIRKTFTLSRKQRMIEKNPTGRKVALDGLSFTAYFGIDQFAEVKVGDLSTGMKQKVSIAVSIIHDPSVIIFDEPTNGLDVLTAKVVTDFLTEMKEQGKSIILSTHIFSLVEKLCDRVGVIIGGRMAAEGTLADVSGGKSLEDAFFDIYKRTVTGE